MFIDHANIEVTAGDGGDGAVSFHRAKYVPRGGPDGGHGGNGGSVIFRADHNLSTLQDFRYKRKYVAQSGQNGAKRKRAGAAGEDLVVRVPLGTLITDANTGQLLADLTEHEEEVVVAQGGHGGVGNSAYATSRRQSPNFAKAGEQGEHRFIQLELKVLADVGLVGMPNVGKSSFLSVVTSATPEVADYHFTTLQPMLGIATVGDSSFTIADIPGLIAGAAEGVGLGHDFLRHIERTRLLVHVLDAAGSEGRDPMEDFRQINEELESFNEHLGELPQIVALNKIDLAEEEDIEALEEEFRSMGYEVFPICAPIQEGTEDLLNAMAAKLHTLPVPEKVEVDTSYRLYDLDTGEEEITVYVAEDGAYVAEAPWLDRFLRSINFDDFESLHYFQKTLNRRGVMAALEAAGLQPGDTVRLGDVEFEHDPLN